MTLPTTIRKPIAAIVSKCRVWTTAGNSNRALRQVKKTVYTLDQQLFFSKDFSDGEPLPTTYLRNAEEHVGDLKNPANNKKWEDTFIDLDTFGTIGALNKQMSVLVNDFVTAVK